MNPFVSVIVPVYQVEKYLAESLNSVRNQTLTNIEIICVDDGSTDACPGILDKEAENDRRITVIHNSNHGYGYSINTGFQAAKGDYLAIVEPDDIIPLNALEILYRLAVKDDLDLVKGDYCQMRTAENGYKYIPAKISSDTGLYHKIFNKNDHPEVLMSQIINCCGIFKRSLVLEKSIRLSETPGASYQDVGLFFGLMLEAKTILFTDKVTYYYRDDNPTASTKNKGKLYMAENEYIKAQERILKLNDKELLAASWSARWRGALGTIARIDKSLYNEFLTYLRPVVEEAYLKGLLKKKYCNAYQWELLLRFLKSDDDFKKGFSSANGKNGNLVRLFWRAKNDGIHDTVCFLKRKIRMENNAKRGR